MNPIPAKPILTIGATLILKAEKENANRLPSHHHETHRDSIKSYEIARPAPLMLNGCFPGKNTMPIWLVLLLGNQTQTPQIQPQLTFKTITYSSFHDKTGPIYADVAFPTNKSALPLLVVMHGYSGNRSAVGPDIRELATKGVFAVAPDMRGCGNSSGKWDSGGLDVHDILDCVLVSIQSFPTNIDSKNLNIVG